MIAVDTNILIYAHRRDSKWHGPAAACVRSLAESTAGWVIAWPCIHEFIAIVTHRKVYVPPSTMEDATVQIDTWLASPRLRLIAEDHAHWAELKRIAAEGKISGPQIHDARIAALCIQHGVSELWTADRDFARFPALKSRNPLVS